MTDISYDARTIWILIGAVLLGILIGYFIGRHCFRITLEPDGEIIFDTHLNEEQEETPRCVFKLDLDISEIKKHDYILFEVIKGE